MEPVDRVRVWSRDGDARTEREDALAVEEPLEIRLRTADSAAPSPFVVTMRTPGADDALAAGLLFAEGVVDARGDLLALERPADPRIDPERRDNVLVATLTGEARARADRLRRATVMGSACGVCGRTSIDDLLPAGRPPVASKLSVAADVLYGLPAALRAGQSVFAETGGLHAAGLFAADGRRLAVAEDIGRHNATDKIVGRRWLDGGLPAPEAVLLVSGRAGFEILQKAFAAGIPVVASVSAPSSLAVALADAAGITLLGFLRERRFNVYSHPARIAG